MRLLYSASLIIMLVDIMTKSPIKEAVILCDGKQNPYVSKDDGYYIFCNLYPGNYNISIFANGYVSKEIQVSLEFGESKRFMLELSFASNNPKLINTPKIEFLILDRKRVSQNINLRLNLKTPVKILKLIQKVKKGDQEIILNVPENNIFILQNYIYYVKKMVESEVEDTDFDSDEGETIKKQSENLDGYIDENDMISYPMFFLGYDKKHGAYILDKEVDITLPIGGTFFPYWNLTTDEKGKVILPIFRNIMSNNKLEFEICLNEKIKSVKVDMNKMDIDIKYKTLKVNVNFD